MVKEAEAHAAEDARHREEIALRNQPDSLVYSTERALPEYSEEPSDDEHRSVEHALKDAKEAIKTDNLENIRRAQEALNRGAGSLRFSTGGCSRQALTR